MEDIEVSQTRKELGVGVTLSVENVQELASKTLHNIPHRYIRPEISLEEVSTDESLQVPVIDMANLAPDQLGYELEMAKLHRACEEWGFFQIINHGATAAIEQMKVVTEEFFKLPLEQKMASAQLPNSIEGFGQAFVFSEDQKLDWGDVLYILCLPVADRNMRFWPNIPTAFRSTLDKYSLELHKICVNLIKSMATNLGVDAEIFSGMFEDGKQDVRFNYYPPCMRADKVCGLTPHTDRTGLTLVVQVNEVDGLQISKDRKWLPVKAIPAAIIINIGDIMEIMSSGKYKSIEHRALVNFQKERLSVAAFHGPSMKTKIGPLPDLVKENGAKYKTLEHEAYRNLVANSKLYRKNLIEQMLIKE